MVETISVQFDPNDLPEWARKHPDVVEMAMRNLAYRCDVYTARTEQVKRALIRLARRGTVHFTI
jgi:hypothetical protein